MYALTRREKLEARLCAFIYSCYQIAIGNKNYLHQLYISHPKPRGSVEEVHHLWAPNGVSVRHPGSQGPGPVDEGSILL